MYSSGYLYSSFFALAIAYLRNLTPHRCLRIVGLFIQVSDFMAISLNNGPVMLDLTGTHLTEEEKGLLLDPSVGGVIFFSRNFESSAQIAELTGAIRAIRPSLLLAVDQEGGRVQRFREGFTRIPAMQQFLPLFRKSPDATLTLVKNSAWLMAAELLAVGIDFSFAPVLDLDDHRSRVIADRSFSPLPEETIALGGAWLEGMHEAGMATTGKHFPGHGGVVGDSHEELPLDKRTLDTIESFDLLPFKKLLNQLDALMPAHILFPQVDPENPVGFSPYWLQEILRKRLSFPGVIFSDDLSMEGAVAAGSYSQRAKLALAAGCDMVLVCNNREGALEVLANLDQPKEPNMRLGGMQARASITQSELESNSRYQLTKHLLTNLVTS